MASLRRREGYLLIENRFAPGPTDAMVNAIRATGQEFINPDVPIFESAVITCSHCQTQLVVNPLRNRAREYCLKCDHYICDGCAFLAKSQPHAVHMTYNQRADIAQNTFARSLAISEL